MRTRTRTPDQDGASADIIRAVAEVSLGRPRIALDQLIREVYAVLPPELSVRLASCKIEDAGEMTVSQLLH